MSTTARHYATDALLRNGRSIHLRAIRPDDKPRLLAFFSCLSPQSVYFRFFQAVKRFTETELRTLSELDFVRHVGLVATLRDADGEHIVGVGHYLGLNGTDGPCPRAEVAFAIADAYQGQGIGTLLLEHLAAIARDNGIEEFEAYVLGENNRMLQVFEASGFRIQRSIDTGVFHVSFPTEETAQVRAAESHRERLAAAQSVRAFLHPRAVAVGGSGPSPYVGTEEWMCVVYREDTNRDADYRCLYTPRDCPQGRGVGRDQGP